MADLPVKQVSTFKLVVEANRIQIRKNIRRQLVCSLVLMLAGGVSIGFQPGRGAVAADKVVRLGFVGPASSTTDPAMIAGFRKRLRELGWTDGENLVIEELWADTQYDRLPALMADMAGRNIDVLITYSTPGALAAKNATRTIPIVVAAIGQPIHSGVVASLAQPGGNLTGLSMGWAEGIGGKWLELLQEVVPGLATVAVIGNPDNPVDQDLSKGLEAIAPARRPNLVFIDVRTPVSVEAAFEAARRRAQAVLVLPDPLTVALRPRVTALAAQHRLPAIYGIPDFADAGGLMAFGPDRTAMFRRAADLVDKILKGARPGDLPVEQPTEFLLVVNLRTAKALGLTIPESILLRANKVIE